MVRLIGAVAVVAVLVAATSAAAHTPDAPPLVKERQAAMKDMQDAIKALAAMVKGEAPFDRLSAQSAADTIHGVTARIDAFYPAGSTYFPRGHALPAVWDQPEAFRQETREALTAAVALREAVAAADDAAALAPAVREAAGTCRSCHDDFKKDD